MSENGLNSYTFRLFKKRAFSPFMDGMSSIWDYSDSRDLYNFDESDSKADRNSIESDWLQVGQDLRFVMHNYVEEKEV